MNWDSDEDLLADLSAAIHAERQVPARFVDAGKAAFAWRSVDAELAELAFDSATSGLARPGTRAPRDAARTMTFTAGELTIDLELTPDALLGQVVPAGAGELRVIERDGTTRSVPVDDIGWFTVQPAPVGTFRLRYSASGERAVVTEWIVG